MLALISKSQCFGFQIPSLLIAAIIIALGPWRSEPWLLMACCLPGLLPATRAHSLSQALTFPTFYLPQSWLSSSFFFPPPSCITSAASVPPTVSASDHSLEFFNCVLYHVPSSFIVINLASDIHDKDHK